MTAPAEWTLATPVRLYGVHVHSITGRCLPWVYDDPQPVEWWISQLFDGPRYVVRDVWLVPDDCKPTGFVDVSERFAELMAASMAKDDPDFWFEDSVNFVDRFRGASTLLEEARREWAAFKSQQRNRAGW